MFCKFVLFYWDGINLNVYKFHLLYCISILTKRINSDKETILLQDWFSQKLLLVKKVVVELGIVNKESLNPFRIIDHLKKVECINCCILISKERFTIHWILIFKGKTIYWYIVKTFLRIHWTKALQLFFLLPWFWNEVREYSLLIVYEFYILNEISIDW